MVVFLVWEAYSVDWKLIRKGSKFMSVENPALIDLEVSDYSEGMAKYLGIKPEHLTITSIQQLDIPE
ncbi:hypothetical protein J5069_07475 [Candidatus Symbiopectobacterium sp. NZEC127]|uniref:hypothetical protein n=1 Tax=Candidatus Symbiopectobacterium sp. NZEC127 TaxID=2820472 RepID=UPI002225EEA2|nr:hypothetical protein [Candidatus Symbiopectobacterium sp. NZEC127]MCW2485736.1 hypothetical protein [Candidatus Symbiopectobacterium sp. NZEC127]